jgi:hypothetical protein
VFRPGFGCRMCDYRDGSCWDWTILQNTSSRSSVDFLGAERISTFNAAALSAAVHFQHPEGRHNMLDGLTGLALLGLAAWIGYQIGYEQATGRSRRQPAHDAEGKTTQGRWSD